MVKGGQLVIGQLVDWLTGDWSAGHLGWVEWPLRVGLAVRVFLPFATSPPLRWPLRVGFLAVRLWPLAAAFDPTAASTWRRSPSTLLPRSTRSARRPWANRA